MDKSEALNRFYQGNHIKVQASADEMDANYDLRIAGLPAQVDAWLSCIDPEDHSYFLTLLSRYHYLTAACCRQRYRRILDLLEQRLQPGCGLAEALFITVESSGGYKSGSDNVRTDLYSRGFPQICKKQITAAPSKLDAEEVRQYRAIVFLDDIVGSGMSLWKPIKTFWDRFNAIVRAEDGPRLYYSCIAPRKHGIQHIQKNCRRLEIPASPLFEEAWYEEPALPRDTRSQDYQRLKFYEETIDSYMRDPDPNHSFFMGFQKNRLLLSFYYNTPNNTLCTFWRETPFHSPLFQRDGDQPRRRPSVASLQTCASQAQSHAYAFGMDRQEKRNDG